jgi:hypothetical protein
MKNKILLLVLCSFLLQSCVSYKSIDKNSDSIVMGATYRIKANNKKYMGTLVNINDTIATLKIGAEKLDIKREEIAFIKKRKFSIAETIAIPVVTVVGVVGLFAATYSPQF